MFKFTIRDLLWLTVVAALGVGWWVDRQQYVRRAEEAEWKLVRYIASTVETISSDLSNPSAPTPNLPSD